MDRLKNMFRNVNPAILIVLVVLILNRILRGGQSLGDWLYDTLLMLPGILVGLTFHEAAHAYVSYWLGDPTPKLDGRLSLNPLHHIDPIGFLALLIAGFGWGEPVRIDPTYYKHKRRDEFLVSIAGVTMNLVVACVGALILRLLSRTQLFLYEVGGIVFQILLNLIVINLVLMIFNLLPVPPLDGFNILTQIFNLRRYAWYWKIQRYGSLILMLLIIFNITDLIISPCVNFFLNLLL